MIEVGSLWAVGRRWRKSRKPMLSRRLSWVVINERSVVDAID